MRLALAGFLAGNCGLAWEACALDLLRYAGWCRAGSLPLVCVRRAGIETLPARRREMLAEAQGLGRP